MIGLLPPLVLIAICCVVIWKAGDAFMVGSNYLGRHLSEGVRGASINAIASSLPELFTSFFFIFYLQQADGFAGGIGTTTGSAIFNSMIIPSAAVLAVIFTGLATEVKLSKRAMRRDGIALIIVECFFIGIISQQYLYWYHGLLLAALYTAYLFYMFSTMKKTGQAGKEQTVIEKAEEIERESSLRPFWKAVFTLDITAVVLSRNKLNSSSALGLLLLSSVLMAVMCYLLVIACEWIGSDTYKLPLMGTFSGLDIPVIFVALILAAAASSIPDTIISVKDAKDGKYDDALSNALGSNIFAICLALGLPLLVFTAINGPIHMAGSTGEQILELSVLLLLLTLVAVLIFSTTQSLGKGRSLALVAIYLLFFLYITGKSTGNPLAEEISSVLLHFFDWTGIL